MIFQRLFGVSRSSQQAKMSNLKYPAAERNKDPILKVLQQLLPRDRQLNALEIASGTGQHVAHFAENIPNVVWQPSDLDPRHVASIDIYASKSSKTSSIKKAVLIDVENPLDRWPPDVAKENFYDLVLAVNMTQVSPFKSTIGLFRNSSVLLKNRGYLVIYGPFAVDGTLTPQSNVEFDRGLRQQNPEWGVRDTTDLKKLGQEKALLFLEMQEMPANNKILVFQKQSH